jgi:hypothetical protein
MCVSCVSTSEQVVAQAALAVAVLRGPLHRRLAAAGVVAPPDPVGRDARTVGFLRALDLDPVAVLGAQVVEQADAWVAPARQARAWRWLRPIGSQSLLSTQ